MDISISCRGSRDLASTEVVSRRVYNSTRRRYLQERRKNHRTQPLNCAGIDRYTDTTGMYTTPPVTVDRPTRLSPNCMLLSPPPLVRTTADGTDYNWLWENRHRAEYHQLIRSIFFSPVLHHHVQDHMRQRYLHQLHKDRRVRFTRSQL
jgi:hypothetical protein